jgi:hypothetical protein
MWVRQTGELPPAGHLLELPPAESPTNEDDGPAPDELEEQHGVKAVAVVGTPAHHYA